MLQTPSKYHPNPLSHFLALHNSVASHHQNHYNHQHNHHSQIQNHTQFINGSNLDGNIATSLDVGKSFTIAAILGLQKNTTIENCQQQQQQQQKDYHSVMNLSLNNHNHQQKSINNNNNVNNIKNDCNGFNVNNNIECDNNLNSNSISKYYSNNSNNVMRSVNNHHNHHQNQLRSHFSQHHHHHHQTAVAAAAAAAVAINNVNVPSALQSLQQLHQHHTQQVSLGFPNRGDKTKSDHISSKKPSLKSKRVRTIFTPEQLERLEAEFERQQYMVGPERLYLAHTLQLTEAQVKVWFQNRRIKWRKHHLEVTQQRLAIMRQTQQHQQQQMPSNCNNENDNNTAAINNSGSINNQIINHTDQSELSICNDSIDDESFTESEEI